MEACGRTKKKLVIKSTGTERRRPKWRITNSQMFSHLADGTRDHKIEWHKLTLVRLCGDDVRADYLPTNKCKQQTKTSEYHSWLTVAVVCSFASLSAFADTCAIEHTHRPTN